LMLDRCWAVFTLHRVLLPGLGMLAGGIRSGYG
jgi:hypothetical protein